MNLLSTLTESPMIRQLPGARFLANQVGEIKTERSINQALNPGLEKEAVMLSPEDMRRIQLLLPAGGVLPGIAGGTVAGQ